MSFILWTIILSKSNVKLSILVPVVGAIVQILIIILGITIFKEKLNIIQIWGIILTTIGIMLITYSKG